MLLLQSQGENNKKYPLGNSPPLHHVWLWERQMSYPAGSASPSPPALQGAFYLQSKGSTKADSGLGQAGISPICLCRTCLSFGQQHTLLIWPLSPLHPCQGRQERLQGQHDLPGPSAASHEQGWRDPTARAWDNHPGGALQLLSWRRQAEAGGRVPTGCCSWAARKHLQLSSGMQHYPGRVMKT